MNIEKMSLAELVAFHNTFCKVMPGLKPLDVKDVRKRSDILGKVQQLNALRPSHIATLEGTSAYAVREALREAAQQGLIRHDLNKPWALTPLDYVKVFCGDKEPPAPVASVDTSTKRARRQRGPSSAAA